MLHTDIHPPLPPRVASLTEADPQEPTPTIATLMFTDIEDSTGLAAVLGLKGISRFLRQHQRMAEHFVTANHGVVRDFTGDGVFAFWSSARAMQSRAAAEALAAAADLSREISATNSRRRAAGLPYRRVRIGIHSGEVLLEERRDGNPPSLYGVTVHQARKIEQAGKGIDAGERDVIVMVSRATLRLAGMEAPADENENAGCVVGGATLFDCCPQLVDPGLLALAGRNGPLS